LARTQSQVTVTLVNQQAREKKEKLVVNVRNPLKMLM